MILYTINLTGMPDRQNRQDTRIKNFNSSTDARSFQIILQ
jgi:hypothetical protein